MWDLSTLGKEIARSLVDAHESCVRRRAHAVAWALPGCLEGLQVRQGNRSHLASGKDVPWGR